MKLEIRLENAVQTCAIFFLRNNGRFYQRRWFLDTAYSLKSKTTLLEQKTRKSLHRRKSLEKAAYQEYKFSLETSEDAPKDLCDIANLSRELKTKKKRIEFSVQKIWSFTYVHLPDAWAYFNILYLTHICEVFWRLKRGWSSTFMQTPTFGSQCQLPRNHKILAFLFRAFASCRWSYAFGWEGTWCKFYYRFDNITLSANG